MKKISLVSTGIFLLDNIYRVPAGSSVDVRDYVINYISDYFKSVNAYERLVYNRF